MEIKKYLDESQRAAANGVAPLNEKGKVPASYLPNYTDISYMPSDDAASLNAKQTWTYEQTFNYEDYGLKLYDNISGISAGFKAPRGLFNQLFVDDIVFCGADNTSFSGANPAKMNEGISFYIFTDTLTKAAIKDKDGKITTPG